MKHPIVTMSVTIIPARMTVLAGLELELRMIVMKIAVIMPVTAARKISITRLAQWFTSLNSLHVMHLVSSFIRILIPRLQI
jgi:hypothetical protein